MEKQIVLFHSTLFLSIHPSIHVVCYKDLTDLHHKLSEFHRFLAI